MKKISDILSQTTFSKSDICTMLSSQGEEKLLLYEKAADLKATYLGNKVFFRGLIEFSNICNKDCYYCGIRKSNVHTRRYNLSDQEILQAAQFAFENNYGSVVLQSGEIQSGGFTHRIENLLKNMMQLSGGKLRVTLSLGEQSEDTYKRWFDSGASRYLLRIETSDRKLYSLLHPQDEIHSFDNRLKALQLLKDIGYQTGTGVMIGLPFQTIENLADDLLFMKDFSIDMVGMGPYIEHCETPLFEHKPELLPVEERFELSLKMIAVLRIMMPKINIASATALQAIDKMGREKAIKTGANVVMPNITPGSFRNDYQLYNNKPCIEDSADDCSKCLDARIAMTSHEIAYGEWGDSLHYHSRMRQATSKSQ